MPTDIQNLYQEIGQLVGEKLPDDWVLAHIVSEESAPGVRSLKAWYETSPDIGGVPFIVGPHITRLLTEVENRLCSANPTSWEKITFSLQRDGRFELHFD